MSYEFKTDFWFNFSLVEQFGGQENPSIIEELYNEIFESCKDNYIELTELTMVTNWKSWDWLGKNDKLATLYEKLYLKTWRYGTDNLNDEEYKYFYWTLD